MPMNNRLLVPRQTLHPEALAWRSAVIANGGSVSGTTMTAVDRFVRSIYAAGIRDRFFRLSLMAGSDLSAALVPVFRGPVFGGTTYGNATDTNVNFVGGDYSLATGLQGASASSKRLVCGTITSSLTADSVHLMVDGVNYDLSNTASGAPIGVRVSDGSLRTYLFTRASSASAGQGHVGTRVSSTALGVSSGVLALSGDASNDLRMYLNGVHSGTPDTVDRGTGALAPWDLKVFCIGNSGSETFFSDARLFAYSIGKGLSASQALAASNALVAFRTAIGRS